MLEHVELPEGKSADVLLRDHFRYLAIPTFSHLLALVLQPPALFPPTGTTLMVVDGLEALLNLDYPRMPYGNGNRSEQQKWQAGRSVEQAGCATQNGSHRYDWMRFQNAS